MANENEYLSADKKRNSEAWRSFCQWQGLKPVLGHEPAERLWQSFLAGWKASADLQAL